MKTMKNKVSALFIVLVMMLSLFPVGAVAGSINDGIEVFWNDKSVGSVPYDDMIESIRQTTQTYTYSTVNSSGTYSAFTCSIYPFTQFMKAVNKDTDWEAASNLTKVVFKDSGYSTELTKATLTEERYYFDKNGTKGSTVIAGFKISESSKGDYLQLVFGQKEKSEQTNGKFFKLKEPASVYINTTDASLDNVTINKGSLELATKKTEILKLSNVPSEAIVTWSSSKPTIAAVDENGVVSAKTYGKAVITATVTSGTETVVRTCNVQTRFYDVADPTMSGFTQIYWAADKGITNGYNGGEYFGPTQKCTRQEFAIFLWRSLGQPKPKSTTLPFSDTKGFTGSSLNAIAWAVEKGIIQGYDDNTFRPKNNVTREQIVIMLWRAAGKPAAAKEPTFADIGSLDKSSSAYKGIAWASENGIVQGFYADNTFRPKDNSKRNQIVIMLYRYVTKLLNN